MVRTVLASAPMFPFGTTLSHVVRDVVSGVPVCPSRISVSYLAQSCKHAFHVRSFCVWLNTVLR